MYIDKHKLLRIYYVQEYTLRMQTEGISKSRIYRNLYRIIPMGYSTFNEYLSVNARAILKEYYSDLNALHKQTEVFINSIPTK